MRTIDNAGFILSLNVQVWSKLLLEKIYSPLI